MTSKPSQWSITEKNRFSRMWMNGRPRAEIARAFKIKSTRIISEWAQDLGLPKRNRSTKGIITRPINTIEQRSRNCMNCRKPFNSYGMGNRMCPDCRNLSVSPFEP